MSGEDRLTYDQLWAEYIEVAEPIYPIGLMLQFMQSWQNLERSTLGKKAVASRYPLEARPDLKMLRVRELDPKVQTPEGLLDLEGRQLRFGPLTVRRKDFEAEMERQTIEDAERRLGGEGLPPGWPIQSAVKKFVRHRRVR